MSLFRLFIKILKFLLILDAFYWVSCDYHSLTACESHESCWPNLSNEIVDLINEMRDNETSPCENFWQHACGGWHSPNHQNYRDNFDILMNNYITRLQDLFESNSMSYQHNFADIPNLVNKVKIFYKNCVENKHYYLDMERYFIEISKRITPTNWKEAITNTQTSWDTFSNITWLERLAELRRFGLNGIIIDERITGAFNDATKFVIEIKMPNADDRNFESKFRLANFLIEFGIVDQVTNELLDLMAQVFELEKQIKELQKRHKKDNDATFEESLTLEKLQEKIPNIDWQTYFRILFEQNEINSSLPIEINGIEYFHDISALLSQWDNKIVALNILLHLCQYIIDTWPSRPMRERCIHHVSLLMPLGVNYLYDRFLYKTRHEDEAALDIIFSKLKQQFHKYLNTNTLDLTEKELDYLREKSNKITLRLGNLPINMNRNFYDHYYDTANLTTHNFYHNHWELLYFRIRQQHMGIIMNRSQFDLNVFYVNDDINQIRNAPYYVHEHNLLIVPMIFMQLPFFYHTLHSVLQQSLIGFILGHEFNHAFEVDGILMDAYGNENSIGFKIKSKPKFLANIECFQQAPTASLSERMADINGFQLAYDAYFTGKSTIDIAQNHIAADTDDKIDERILFFLNFAQFFCGKLPEPIDHDRDDVRVNEIVRNMPEFQSIFQCNQNKQKNMNLCTMWRK